MNEIRIEGGVLLFDPQATRAIYNQKPKGGADVCGCSHCRNYLLAREGLFTPDKIQFLETFGIDYQKDNEVFHLNKAIDGRHHYGGWFHLVGRINPTADPEEGATDLPDWDDLHISFSVGGACVWEEFGGYPVVQMDIEFRILWLLPNEEPE